LRESWSRLHRRVANAKLNGAENAKWNIEGWDRPGQPLRYPVPCKSICLDRVSIASRSRLDHASIQPPLGRFLEPAVAWPPVVPKTALPTPRPPFGVFLRNGQCRSPDRRDADGRGRGRRRGGADIKFSRPRAGEPIRRLQRRQLTGPNERVPRSS
jgi:hypothetical protein